MNFANNKVHLVSLTLSLSVMLMQTGISAKAQTIVNGSANNAIITAVPFVTITPDSRAGAMGETGGATSPDANGTFWNPGKMAFTETPIAASLAYTPWLRGLQANDVYLAYLSGYKKFSREDALSFSMNYFSLGSIAFKDENNAPMGDAIPNEYTISIGYSRRLSNTLSIGVAPKFIHSNLTGSWSAPAGTDFNLRPANTAAVDLGAYYTKELSIGGNPSVLNFGLAIHNFGPKISYSNNNRRDFIPTTLRLATAFNTDIDEHNKISFSIDATKLMVPTPGPNADSTLMGGVFSSFGDAPGGFKEEMQEIMLGGGVEYWYDNLFALRGGYFHEANNKGARKYFTVGVGLRYQKFGMDFAYLIPTTQNHPLANTLRFTLLFEFGGVPAASTVDPSPIQSSGSE